MTLHGKVAVVTGASSGIGRATTRLFAREGASLALLARDGDALGALEREVQADECRALALPTDVTDRDQCAAAVEATASQLGRVDVLVNAAGIIAGGSIEDTSRVGWDQMMRVNVDAVFELMRIAVPHLKRSQGAIVNVSSVTGLRAFPGILAYCVSKAAVDQLTRCAALELAPSGVRVNAVNPGVVETELHRRSGMSESDYRAFLGRSGETHPLGRHGQPEEVAEAILYLASARSGWVTGVTLSVDGGRHLTCAR